MGAILVIEDDHELRGLIEKILPQNRMRDMGASTDGGPRSRFMNLSLRESKLAQTLEEMVREVLRAEVDTGNADHIHESIIGKVERTLIGIVLEEEGGNQVRTAKRLGINRNTLRKKIKDLHITTRVVSN